jgi:hypothetical protein
MRTGLFRCGLSLLVLSFATATLADDLADVEKKIEETWSKLRSMSAKMSMKSDMSSDAFKMSSDSNGSNEFMRKGD